MMKHKIITRVVTLLTIAIAFTGLASAQNRQTKAHKAEIAPAATEKRSFAPGVRGRSDSFIIEGEITAITRRSVTVRAKDGKAYVFNLDDQPTTLESGEIFSIATMADISIKPEDLRVYDRIEVVAERSGRASSAKIITRIEQGSNTVAKR